MRRGLEQESFTTSLPDILRVTPALGAPFSRCTCESCLWSFPVDLNKHLVLCCVVLCSSLWRQLSHQFNSFTMKQTTKFTDTHRTYCCCNFKHYISMCVQIQDEDQLRCFYLYSFISFPVLPVSEPYIFRAINSNQTLRQSFLSLKL